VKVLYEGERVVGVATNDMGIAKSGSRKPNFQRGIELKGMSILFVGHKGHSMFLQPIFVADCWSICFNVS
jgi:hypothetical protein